MIGLTLQLTVDMKYRNLQFSLLPVHCFVIYGTIRDTFSFPSYIMRFIKCYIRVSNHELSSSRPINQSFSTAAPMFTNGDDHKPVPYHNFACIGFLSSPSWSSHMVILKTGFIFEFCMLGISLHCNCLNRPRSFYNLIQ
jgi:hypothetical protein